MTDSTVAPFPTMKEGESTTVSKKEADAINSHCLNIYDDLMATKEELRVLKENKNG